MNIENEMKCAACGVKGVTLYHEFCHDCLSDLSQKRSLDLNTVNSLDSVEANRINAEMIQFKNNRDEIETVSTQTKCRRCGAEVPLYHGVCVNCIEPGSLPEPFIVSDNNKFEIVAIGVEGVLERFKSDFENYQNTSLEFKELRDAVDGAVVPPKPQTREELKKSHELHISYRTIEKRVKDEKERFFRPVKIVQDIISETFKVLSSKLETKKNKLWKDIQDATFQIEETEKKAAREALEKAQREADIERYKLQLKAAQLEEKLKQQSEAISSIKLETDDDIYRAAEMHADRDSLAREKQGLFESISQAGPVVVPEVEVPIEKKFESENGSTVTRPKYILNLKAMSKEDYETFYGFVLGSKKFEFIELNVKAIQKTIEDGHLDPNSILNVLPGIRLEKILAKRSYS